MTISAYTVKRHLVQLAVNWGTWFTMPDLECTQADQGQGQVLGNATLVQRLGQVAQPRQAIAAVPYANYCGSYVRLLVPSVSGDITYDGLTWIEIWHGEVMVTEFQDAGGGSGYQTFQCLGLPSILGKIYIARGADERTDVSGQTFADLGYLPPFNRVAGLDRTEIAITLGSGISAFAHERGGEGWVWTAGNVLNHILELCAHGETSPEFARRGTLRWSASDPQGCLNYSVADLDLNGMTVLDAVNAIINVRRGLTWSLAVVGNDAIIVVRSISASTIVGGTYTLPAASSPVSVDLTTGYPLERVSFTEDHSQCYDIIQITGAKPWIGLTLAYDPTPGTAVALEKGWTPMEESIWLDGGAVEVGGNIGILETLSHVYCRFILSNAWLGGQLDSTTVGLRDFLTFDANGNTDGSRTHDEAEHSQQPRSLELTADTPYGLGFKTNATGARQPAIIVAGSDSDPVQLAGARNIASESWRGRMLGVSDTQEPPGILVGSGPDDQNEICFNLGNDAPVLFATVGVREGIPLLVRWVAAAWLRDVPRILNVNCPWFEQWKGLAGTVVGVDANSNLVTTTSTVSIRDDLPAMRHALALLRAYYSQPARNLAWSQKGVIDFGSDWSPGRLVSTATLGIGTLTVNAVITRRSWDFTEQGYGTHYQTERLVPDLESIR